MTTFTPETVEAVAKVRKVLNWAWDAADTNEDREWITEAMDAFGQALSAIPEAEGGSGSAQSQPISALKSAVPEAGGSGMVERVARILEPQAWAALGLCDMLAYKNRRTSSLRKASKAIEAMLEPTEAMYDALSATDKMWREQTSTTVWRTMIDGALRPDQSPANPSDAPQVEGRDPGRADEGGET